MEFLIIYRRLNSRGRADKLITTCNDIGKRNSIEDGTWKDKDVKASAENTYETIESKAFITQTEKRRQNFVLTEREHVLRPNCVKSVFVQSSNHFRYVGNINLCKRNGDGVAKEIRNSVKDLMEKSSKILRDDTEDHTYKTGNTNDKKEVKHSSNCDETFRKEVISHSKDNKNTNDYVPMAPIMRGTTTTLESNNKKQDTFTSENGESSSSLNEQYMDDSLKDESIYVLGRIPLYASNGQCSDVNRGDDFDFESHTYENIFHI